MYSILRTYHPEATTSIFLDPMGNKLCVLLGKPWLDNKHFISCIPEGVYQVKKYHSQKFPNAFEFQHVPDRTVCLIHNANHVGQLEGCEACGERIIENFAYKGKVYSYWVNNSFPTLQRLNKVLPESFLVDIRKG